MEEANPVGAVLAHADDAAAAHVDPRLADALERLEPVAIGAGGDDLCVIFGRGVDIVVVIVESRLGEPIGLVVGEHAQGHAGLEAHRLDPLDHRQDRIHVAVLGAAPSRAHAEALRTRGLCLARGFEHLLDHHQLGRLEVGLVACRLAAIAAILGTAAGLDRQQGRELDRVGIMILAVHALGPPEQVVERQIEQRRDLGPRPIVTHFTPLPGREGGRRRIDCLAHSAASS